MNPAKQKNVTFNFPPLTLSSSSSISVLEEKKVLGTKMCRIITNLCVDITGEV